MNNKLKHILISLLWFTISTALLVETWIVFENKISEDPTSIWALLGYPIVFLSVSFICSIIYFVAKDLNEELVDTKIEIIKYNDRVVWTCSEYTETFYDIEKYMAEMTSIYLFKHTNVFGSVSYSFRVVEKNPHG